MKYGVGLDLQKYSSLWKFPDHDLCILKCLFTRITKILIFFLKCFPTCCCKIPATKRTSVFCLYHSSPVCEVSYPLHSQMSFHKNCKDFDIFLEVFSYMLLYNTYYKNNICFCLYHSTPICEVSWPLHSQMSFHKNCKDFDIFLEVFSYMLL